MARELTSWLRRVGLPPVELSLFPDTTVGARVEFQCWLEVATRGKGHVIGVANIGRLAEHFEILQLVGDRRASASTAISVLTELVRCARGA